MCTEEDIAGFFGVSLDTIERRCKEWYSATFADIYKELSAKGRVSVRRAQFKLISGESPNCSMAIWLGKQYLGQSDVNKIDHTSKGEKMSYDVVFIDEEME